jgi:hypothetical protein
MKYNDFIIEELDSNIIKGIKRETDEVLGMIKKTMSELLEDCLGAVEDEKNGFVVKYGHSQSNMIEEIKDYFLDIKDELDWCLADVLIRDYRSIYVVYQNKKDFYRVRHRKPQNL